IAFCERAFPTPGRLVDLGCGTGRLCVRFAAKGYECVGVDLSDEMLAKARENAAAADVRVEWLKANLVDLAELPDASFDYTACLFSTLGMVRGDENRAKVLAGAGFVVREVLAVGPDGNRVRSGSRAYGRLIHGERPRVSGPRR